MPHLVSPERSIGRDQDALGRLLQAFGDGVELVGVQHHHAHLAACLAERAQEELLTSGARPRRVAVSGAASLTAAKRRGAQLAAEGMTNREIAQALFVTLKTVEMHLSNACRKLGIHSRSQLAGAAVGRALIVVSAR